MLSGCNGLVNLAWYHPAIVVFVGHWMVMVLLFVQLLVGLSSKHYPPKNQNVTWEGTVSKGKLSCKKHFSGDILVLRGSRKNILWQHLGYAKLLLLQLLLSVHENHRGESQRNQYPTRLQGCLDRISNRHGGMVGFSSQVFFLIPDY